MRRRLRLLTILLPLALTACSSGGSSEKSIQVEVSGTIRYQDKLYDSRGFLRHPTGELVEDLKPVRHAVVELVGDRGVIAITTTDNDGRYALNGSGSRPYIRVLSRNDGALGHGVEVVQTSNPARLYSVRSNRLSETDNLIDLDITLDRVGAVAGVFNILDVYQSAAEFTAARWQNKKPPLQVRWEECSSSGTFTRSTVTGAVIINLLGKSERCNSGSIDTDEYDDDVMWHEYGHYLEIVFGNLDSPGGSHSLIDLGQDLRLSWSEGWSSFISGAVKEWLADTYPERLSIETALSANAGGSRSSLYVDTFGTAAFSYDFRTGSLFGQALLYATNEGAIAKILWGINDDVLFNFSTLWQVFTNQLNVAGISSNLEGVWKGWLSGYSPTETDKSAIRRILRDRRVYYEIDASENDNTLAEARPLRPEPNRYTLFINDGLNQDVDLVPFVITAGNQYRIETYDLHNGADTFLRILDATGTVFVVGGAALSNDNHTTSISISPSPNDTCRLSSRIEFSADINGIYYAEIHSSANRPAAAGRLGDYQLLITENPPQGLSYKCP